MTSSWARSTPWLVVLAAVSTVLALGLPAAGQSVTDGPAVVADRSDLQIGERVRVTITGFDAPVVVIAVCGNEARRGSVDCDNRGAQARETTRDGTPTLGSVVVGAPPAPCPCIIRVTSDDNAEVAVVPITVIGHPVAEIVEPSEFVQPLVVDVSAVRLPGGFGDRIRSSLGGPLRYEVTYVVRNTATFDVDDVRATARFTRERYSDERSITIDDPGTIPAGGIWEQVVEVDVPSLTIGNVTWRMDVSGIGAPVIATTETSYQPIGLYVVAIVLMLDVVILLVRLVRLVRRRRRTRRSNDKPSIDLPPFGDLPAPDGPAHSDPADERRVPELVG